MIWGNHESFGSIESEMMTEEGHQFATLLAEGLDIRVLYGSAIEIADVRVRLIFAQSGPAWYRPH